MDKNKYCKICESDDIEEIVQMGCKHYFCKFCLNTYFKIDENFQIDNFKCPVEDCNRSFDTADLMKFVNNFEETADLLMQNNICFGLNPNERLITCFNRICKSKFIVWKDADYFTCSSCQQSFCLKCNLEKHPGLTCFQRMRQSSNFQSQIRFYDFAVENLNIKPCPKCYFLIEKDQGCNYITCISKQCQGKTHFCFECNVILSKDELRSHYEDSDYFNGKCRIKINSQWLNQGQIRQNKFECPGCQSKNPKECYVEKNIDNQLIVCNSSKCQNKHYCLHCKQQLNQYTLDEHINNNFQHSIMSRIGF